MDINYTAADFDHSPLMFYFEVTTACDLVCKHYRASAQSAPNPQQLSTQQSKLLLSQVATFPKRPMVVPTGGVERAHIRPLLQGNEFFSLSNGASQLLASRRTTPHAATQAELGSGTDRIRKSVGLKTRLLRAG
jgi:MoaA/NifB/PqqE/SkfB family radical SAM enzyme